MKRILSLLLFSAFAFTGCESDRCTEDIRQLHLGSRVVVFNGSNMSATVRIVDGNGGYRIYHPLGVDYISGYSGNGRELIEAKTDGDVIVIETAFDPYELFEAVFLVVDAKEKKQLLVVRSIMAHDGGSDYGWYEKKFADIDPADYWDMDNPG